MVLFQRLFFRWYEKQESCEIKAEKAAMKKNHPVKKLREEAPGSTCKITDSQ